MGISFAEREDGARSRSLGTGMSAVSAEPPKRLRSISTRWWRATPALRAILFAASISAEWRWPYLNVRAWTAKPSFRAIASTVVESSPPLRRTTAGDADFSCVGEDAEFTGSASPLNLHGNRCQRADAGGRRKARRRSQSAASRAWKSSSGTSGFDSTAAAPFDRTLSCPAASMLPLRMMTGMADVRGEWPREPFALRSHLQRRGYACLKTL